MTIQVVKDVPRWAKTEPPDFLISLVDLVVMYRGTAGRMPRTIVLSPDKMVQFASNIIGLHHKVGTADFGQVVAWRFMGIPVVLEVPSEFCKNCGAQVLKPICSYCKTNSEYIRLE